MWGNSNSNENKVIDIEASVNLSIKYNADYMPRDYLKKKSNKSPYQPKKVNTHNIKKSISTIGGTNEAR